ncbi:hypothetical protein ACOMHN_008455 [Nucella lapillus]
MLHCFERKDNDCDWPGAAVKCVAELKDICPLKEEGITFQELTTLSSQFCQQINIATRGRKHCKAAQQCVLKSDIVKKIFGDLQERPLAGFDALVSMSMESRAWCQFMDATARCVVVSGDSCGYEPPFLTFMEQQHKLLSAICSSASNGGKGSAGIFTLALLCAVFITAEMLPSP